VEGSRKVRQQPRKRQLGRSALNTSKQRVELNEQEGAPLLWRRDLLEVRIVECAKLRGRKPGLVEFVITGRKSLRNGLSCRPDEKPLTLNDLNRDGMKF
jgi:hypothetical protein